MSTLTNKQLGDAAEHFVIAMLGFAGTPATKMPDNWPGYDVMAVHPKHGEQTISVKCRSQANKWANPTYGMNDRFDWMAFVYVMNDGTQRTWLIPRQVCDQQFGVWNVKVEMVNNCYANRIIKNFARFEDNFTLDPEGTLLLNRFIAEMDEIEMGRRLRGPVPTIPHPSDLKGINCPEAEHTAGE